MVYNIKLKFGENVSNRIKINVAKFHFDLFEKKKVIKH